eukprot:1522439-Prymnesium_polylepis.1
MSSSSSSMWPALAWSNETLDTASHTVAAGAADVQAWAILELSTAQSAADGLGLSQPLQIGIVVGALLVVLSAAGGSGAAGAADQYAARRMTTQTVARGGWACS